MTGPRAIRFWRIDARGTHAAETLKYFTTLCNKLFEPNNVMGEGAAWDLIECGQCRTVLANRAGAEDTDAGDGEKEAEMAEQKIDQTGDGPEELKEMMQIGAPRPKRGRAAGPKARAAQKAREAKVGKGGAIGAVKAMAKAESAKVQKEEKAKTTAKRAPKDPQTIREAIQLREEQKAEKVKKATGPAMLVDAKTGEVAETTKSGRAKRPEVKDGERFCGRCETTKKADQFPIAKSGPGKGKPQGWCKACRSEHAKAKREASKAAA